MEEPRLHKGELIDLSVINLAFGGAGIAKIGEFVVFVTGAVPGDVVSARMTKVKKRYAEARAEKILSPSPDRIPHRCQSFGACGGCVWQGLDYGVQLQYKTRQVRESLEHLGGLRDFELLPIAGMADPWRYRNRADFSIGTSDEGAVVGFRPPGRWDAVLSLSECHLLELVLEQARATVEAWLRDEGLPGWEPRRGAGFARHLLARSAQGGASSFSVWSPSPASSRGRSARRTASLRSSQLVGLVHAINGGKAEISSGLESTTLWGRPYCWRRCRHHPQGVGRRLLPDEHPNDRSALGARRREVTAAMTARRRGSRATGTRGRPALAAGPVIWDLFFGVGSIGLSLAGRARAVLGIEAISAAVDDARENARLNGIENAYFIEGDVAKILREVADGGRELPEPVTKGRTSS